MDLVHPRPGAGRRPGRPPGRSGSRRSGSGWSAAIALTHPFTALTAAFGAAGILAYRVGRLNRAGWLLVGGATVVALVTRARLAVLLLLSLAGSREFDEIHYILYAYAPQFFGLALVTVPALWLRARRCWYDPLVVLFVLGLVTLVVGWLTGAYALARVWPAVLLAGQIATGVELPALAGAWRRWYRPVVLVALAVRPRVSERKPGLHPAAGRGAARRSPATWRSPRRGPTSGG